MKRMSAGKERLFKDRETHMTYFKILGTQKLVKGVAEFTVTGAKSTECLATLVVTEFFAINKKN
jgi:hypothetical protein